MKYHGGGKLDKKYISLVLVLLAFSALVYAYTINRTIEVQTCEDSDNGLNFLVEGNITGLDLNDTYYEKNDYCIDNLTIMEYGCYERDNSTFAVEVYENCTAINTTSCSIGKCI